MTSELERTNSWLPFLEALEESLLKKDFRVATVRRIFRFIDPDFDTTSIGFKNYCGYLFFWHTTEKGRLFRYRNSFFLLKKELFQGAPQSVIETYNAYLRALFGAASSSFLVPNSWIRQHKTKRELWIERGQKAERELQEWKPLKSLFEFKEQAPSVLEEKRAFPIVQEHRETILVPELVEEAFQTKQRLLASSALLPKECPGKDLFMRELHAVVAAPGTDLSLFETRLQKMWQDYALPILEDRERKFLFFVRLAFQEWACVSGELPWQDMQTELGSVRPSFYSYVERLYATAGAQEEMEALFLEVVRDDDIRVFLGELVHRSLRKKDLLQAILQHRYESIQLLTYANSVQPSLVADLKAFLQQWQELLISVMAPYAVATKEEVALFFRDHWESFEGLKRQLEQYRGIITSHVSSQQLETYVRDVARYVLELPSGRAWYDALCPLSSLDAIFTWQREHIGSELLLMTLPVEKRKRLVEHVVEYRKKEKEIERLQESLIRSVAVDGSFLQDILFSMRVMFEISFLQLEEDVPFLPICVFVEQASLLFWKSLPQATKLAMEERGERCDLLLHRFLEHRDLNFHGSMLKLLLSCHETVSEWYAKKEYAKALELSGLVQEACKEFLTLECHISQRTLHRIGRHISFTLPDEHKKGVPFSLPVIGGYELSNTMPKS